MSALGAEFHYAEAVRYSDVDQMQFLHHSNYARYYENARWGAFRQMGLNYAALEQEGLLMPVVSMRNEFRRPAFYGDTLQITTRFGFKTALRLEVQCKAHNQKGELLNSAWIELTFMNKETRRPCAPPDYLRDALLGKNLAHESA